MNIKITPEYTTDELDKITNQVLFLNIELTNIITKITPSGSIALARRDEEQLINASNSLYESIKAINLARDIMKLIMKDSETE